MLRTMNIAASAPRSVGGVRRRVGSYWGRFRVEDSAARWSGSATRVTTTRTGKRATKEQRAASEYLGSLDDSLAPWVQSTGPIDAYEMHLPVKCAVRSNGSPSPSLRGSSAGNQSGVAIQSIAFSQVNASADGSTMQWAPGRRRSAAPLTGYLSRAAAIAIYNRLVAQLGGSITAERVIATDEQTMRGVGLSHPKARAIRGLAELADDGLLELDKLAAMSDTEIENELVAVAGVGPSSAQMFMMRYLHRPDIFPAGDLGVRAAVTALDGLDKRITPKAVVRRSEVWRPYRSYATSYLWGYIWELRHPAGG